MLFYCELGDASALDKEGCLRLLKASLLGAETGGAAFAVHEQLDKILLWKRFDDAFADCPAFEKALNGFLAQASAWKPRLAATPDNAANGMPMDIMPPFGIPV